MFVLPDSVPTPLAYPRLEKAQKQILCILTQNDTIISNSLKAKLTQEFPQKCCERHGQRGRLLHNEQFAPFYGSVAFEDAPNLHAGLCGTKRVRMEAQLLVVSQPPPLAFLVFVLSDWGEACATSVAVGGGAPGPPQAGTGRGRLPPAHSCA